MAEGRIYVLTNGEMPNLVKVGKTTASSEERSRALSSATGVPTAFSVFKTYEVADCDVAERVAHKVLEHTVGRASPNREFFWGPASTVTHVLDDALACHLRADVLIDCAEAMRKVSRKEFTLACIEFEHAFRAGGVVSPTQSFLDRNLPRFLGAYLACCCTTNRAPKYQHFLTDVRFKGEVLGHAQDVMTAWSSDPLGTLLPFLRQIDR